MNRRLSQHTVALGGVVRLARVKLLRKTSHPCGTECLYQRGNASAPQFPGCRCAAQLERPLWRDGGLDASRAQESRRERSPEEDDERSAMWKCSERATLPLARKSRPWRTASVTFQLSTIGSFDSLKRTSGDFIPLVDFMTGYVCRWCRLRYRLTDNAQCELLFAAWAPLPHTWRCRPRVVLIAPVAFFRSRGGAQHTRDQRK